MFFLQTHLVTLMENKRKDPWFDPLPPREFFFEKILDQVIGPFQFFRKKCSGSD
jgi:hypothetical protein